jgi:hypothetical protein
VSRATFTVPVGFRVRATFLSFVTETCCDPFTV